MAAKPVQISIDSALLERVDADPETRARGRSAFVRAAIWLLSLPRPDKRRPVLVLSRPSLIGLLHTVTVAAVTSTLRGHMVLEPRAGSGIADLAQVEKFYVDLLYALAEAESAR
jgi:hypothetical protein